MKDESRCYFIEFFNKVLLFWAKLFHHFVDKLFSYLCEIIGARYLVRSEGKTFLHLSWKLYVTGYMTASNTLHRIFPFLNRKRKAWRILFSATVFFFIGHPWATHLQFWQYLGKQSLQGHEVKLRFKFVLLNFWQKRSYSWGNHL